MREPHRLKDHHKLRAWDGESYWYLKDDGLFWQDGPFWEDGTSRNMVAHSVIPKMEIEICSGLRDKNGKLIFENDGIPIAGYGLYIAEFPFAELYEAYYENDIGKIIGNIRRNPELLKGK